AEATAETLAERLRDGVVRRLKRRGVVVALSGGIDSSCVAALAVRALGPERVFGLMMPERDSSGESLEYAKELAQAFGIKWEATDIAPILEAAGCYRSRDEAVRAVFPALTPGCRWKIAMHGDRVRSDALNVFYVVVQTEDGQEHRVRLTPSAYVRIVA